jgi:mRNA interferase RelE/StbE
VSWDYKFTEQALKQLKKLGRPAQKRIIEFLDTHIVGATEPHQYGRALTGDLHGLWRYRVGEYRIVCQIQDDVLVVLVVRVGHRKNVYNR